MADILSQEEIDALLDVVEDNDSLRSTIGDKEELLSDIESQMFPERIYLSRDKFEKVLDIFHDNTVLSDRNESLENLIKEVLVSISTEIVCENSPEKTVTNIGQIVNDQMSKLFEIV